MEESSRILLSNKAFCKSCKQLVQLQLNDDDYMDVRSGSECACGNIKIRFDESKNPVHLIKSQEDYIDACCWLSKDEFVVGDVYSDLIKVLNTLEKAATRIIFSQKLNKVSIPQINKTHTKIFDLINHLDKK